MAVDIERSKIKTSASRRGQVYRFGTQHNGNDLLKRGWGDPEADFVWSTARSCSLSIPIFLDMREIVIGVWGYSPGERPPQDVLVFVDGLMKGHFEVDGKTTLRLEYARESTSDFSELVFYLPTAVSPREAEGSNDSRQLGIALAVLETL